MAILRNIIANFLDDYNADKQTQAYGKLGAALSKEPKILEGSEDKSEINAQLKILSQKGKLGLQKRAKAFSSVYENLSPKYKEKLETIYEKSEADSK